MNLATGIISLSPLYRIYYLSSANTVLESVDNDILYWLHCKDKIPKFRNKHYQKRNIGVSVPIFTFMRLRAIYIFPRSVCLLCWRKYVNRPWYYINRSQTHECGNWGWGRAIPRKGIHKWDFRCSVSVFHPDACCRSTLSGSRPATTHDVTVRMTSLHMTSNSWMSWILYIQPCFPSPGDNEWKIWSPDLNP